MSSSRLKRGSSSGSTGSSGGPGGYMKSTSSGLKGMIKSVSKFGYNSAITIASNGGIVIKHGYNLIGSTGFAVATTAMIIFMPLLFEIAREAQVRCRLMFISHYIYLFLFYISFS
jgi:hypothetical protein